MFELKAIQAAHGDALLVSFGDDIVRHILVDGGPSSTLNNLLSVLEGIRINGVSRLELLVVSHYDLDHIGGVLDLLRAAPAWLSIGDIWFNGRHHSQHHDELGPREGDELSELIKRERLPWNLAFDGRRVASGPDPWISIEGGLKIKVVSPSANELYDVARAWARDTDKSRKLALPADSLGRSDVWPALPFANFKREPMRADTSPANGSSIGLLLEYGQIKVLLAADTFPAVVVDSLSSLDEKPVEVALLKLSHHGSQGNTSGSLLRAIECRNFLVSTDGSIHRHPDQALIARILDHVANPNFVFNYDNTHTGNWKVPPKGWPRYTCQYPCWDEPFVRVPLRSK